MSEENIRIGRLIECTFAEALEVRNRGFEQYYSDMSTTMERLIANFHNNSIKPELSVIAFADDKPVGFVFIGVKTVDGKKLAWNGGTGVIPEYRGKGIAKAMMIEAQRVIQEQEVDRATLEVVTKNTHAIAAYQKGGFRIVGQLIGMTRTEPLEQPFYTGSLPQGWQFSYGKAADVRQFPFYREKVAWGGMWHNMIHGESLVLRDDAGQVAGYVLFVRSLDASGQLKTVALRQCEVDPDRNDTEQVFRMMLNEVYGPSDQPVTRKTGDLAMEPEISIRLLKEAGFKTDYEQYLMIMDKEEGEAHA